VPGTWVAALLQAAATLLWVVLEAFFRGTVEFVCLEKSLWVMCSMLY
jgi:hypothetical protein